MPQYRRVALVATAAVALLVVLIIPRCSNDDDPSDARQDDNGDNGEEEETPTAPAEDGSTPDPPDLDQELAKAESADGRWEVVVNDLRQEEDRVTLWATFTNMSEDRDGLGRSLADPTLGELDQAVRGDLSGVYLVDWTAGKAYYPMATDQGENGACLCSRVNSVFVQPDESLAVFAVYNGVADLEDATVVFPGFLPADGLTPP